MGSTGNEHGEQVSANAGKIAGHHVVVDAKKGLNAATLASGIRSTVGVSGQYIEKVFLSIGSSGES